MSIDFSFELMVSWAQSFDTFCVLNSHVHDDTYGKYEGLIAVGTNSECSADIQQLDTFAMHSWRFGFLSYDLKDVFYPTLSNIQKIDKLNFPDFYFFEPLYVLGKKRGAKSWEILQGNTEEIIGQLNAFHYQSVATSSHTFKIQSRFSKEEYLQKVQQLQQHISRGDIYEINFCQEFFVENIYINPEKLFWDLNAVSPKPFSSFFKKKNQYIIGASPERFLTRQGNRLYAQPIKGTAPAVQDVEENERIKYSLLQSEKERSENVMIVDLMRNDLTRIAIPKSVKVEELFGIYSFAQVHQMISTISCNVPSDIKFSEILRATFPMGSMTGAPKMRAMELIERVEPIKRGAFSGSVGYIAPNGDFDLNVVIRSMIYDQQKAYLSFEVGSAITHLSDAEQEYEECLLKAKAIFEALKRNQKHIT